LIDLTDLFDAEKVLLSGDGDLINLLDEKFGSILVLSGLGLLKVKSLKFKSFLSLLT